MGATRERLRQAAEALFAERGFRGATMRAIAERAGTNLASAHYHFGSKRALYLDVAFGLFSGLEERMDAAGLRPSDAELARLSRAELEVLLRARVELLLAALLDPPGHHGSLILRELMDPTPALAEMVKRFVVPLRREMERLFRALEPGLSEADAERCVWSVAGQIFFQRTHRPALLLMMGRKRTPPGWNRTLADHITAFALGGLAALAAGATARSTTAHSAALREARR